MKNKGTTIAVIVLITVIVLQILFVHPGIALNNVSALGVPFVLIELLQPTENLVTGEYIAPTNFYSSVCTGLHAEHTSRSVLIGRQLDYTYDAYGKDELKFQCYFYLLIWVVLCVELVMFIKRTKDSIETSGLLLLITAALSVNIGAELIYLLFGYVNAVLSYGIALALFIFINNKYKLSEEYYPE